MTFFIYFCFETNDCGKGQWKPQAPAQGTLRAWSGKNQISQAQFRW
jgi:hypothetical protein